MRFWIPLSIVLLTGTPGVLLAASEASLRGSPASMKEQNRIAKAEGLGSYRTPAEIRAAAERGELVALEGNVDYELADRVSFPYVKPAVALFVERLSSQYRAACGQKLVVTSGTRPTTQQPVNSHELSVHPMGMAVDLRVSDRSSCRGWLESALLGLESAGVLNATREYRPPHYHIAIFPTQYLAYAAPLIEQEQAERAENERLAMAKLAAASSGLVASDLPPAETPLDGAPRLFAVLGALLIAGSIGAKFLPRRGGR